MTDKLVSRYKYGGLRELWPFYVAWLLETCSIATLFTTMQRFVSVEYGVKGARLGLIVSLFAAMMVIGNVVVGKLADHHCKIKVFCYVIAWEAAFAFLSGFSTSFNQLLIARALAGMCGSPLPLAFAYVGARAEGFKASSMFSIVSSITSLAFIVMPLVIELIEEMFEITQSSSFFVRRFGFFLAGTLSGVASLIGLLFVPSASNATTTGEPAELSRDQTASKVWSLATLKTLPNSGMLDIWLSRFFCCWCHYSVTSTGWALCKFLYPELTEAQRVYNLVLSVGGATAFIAQSILFNVLDKSIGSFNTYKLSVGLMITGTACNLLALRINPYMIMLSYGMLWMGSGLSEVCVVTVLRAKLKATGDPDRNAALSNGVVTSFKSLSQILSPMAANALFWFSRDGLYIQASAACIVGLGFAFRAARVV